MSGRPRSARSCLAFLAAVKRDPSLSPEDLERGGRASLVWSDAVIKRTMNRKRAGY